VWKVEISGSISQHFRADWYIGTLLRYCENARKCWYLLKAAGIDCMMLVCLVPSFLPFPPRSPSISPFPAPQLPIFVLLEVHLCMWSSFLVCAIGCVRVSSPGCIVLGQNEDNTGIMNGMSYQKGSTLSPFSEPEFEAFSKKIVSALHCRTRGVIPEPFPCPCIAENTKCSKCKYHRGRRYVPEVPGQRDSWSECRTPLLFLQGSSPSNRGHK